MTKREAFPLTWVHFILRPYTNKQTREERQRTLYLGASLLDFSSCTQTCKTLPSPSLSLHLLEILLSLMSLVGTLRLFKTTFSIYSDEKNPSFDALTSPVQIILLTQTHLQLIEHDS
ncbi:hypothetical protein SAY86_019622 [Trapa natans]|uniref:Uncharacterized protein n=1 Tax=Trapa natans TaxID=22666 RepID=A0AAN7LXV1_TRANT|nr:hypothetical protein SAY86_019622 [Trapa natans]